jgi:integrase
MISYDCPATKAGTNYLTEAEEKRLFRCMKDRNSQQAQRDLVLLKICRGLGLRRGEALALNVGDVARLDRLDINVRIAEKGGVGDLYIPMDIQALIRQFILKKRRWGEDVSAEAPLFVSKKGRRLSARAFNDLMDKWCAEAGIPRYTPHALRHTKAQRIMADMAMLAPEEHMKKLLFVKRQLRHKSINATAIYTGPTKEEMQRVADI